MRCASAWEGVSDRSVLNHEDTKDSKKKLLLWVLPETREPRAGSHNKMQFFVSFVSSWLSRTQQRD